jgi:AP-1 complex subunit beta-1
VFFCKYNDPIYVKMEKLEIMVKLASERNIDQELMELKEYATEVDIEFVRRAVRCIGRCAIKIEKAAERCINALLELIQTKVNYVVQEAVIVIKDIFRKYPNRYESIIGTLCENLDTLDEPEAKASMVWIIGEYAERIDNADELLESFLETFADEPPMVQLQLLTATVKLFLKRPADTQKMVQDVLNRATQESDDPDLRDRGYIYWRLLSTDPEAAKQVVLAEKPTITDDISALEPQILDELIANLSTLASIYHKPPSSFMVKSKAPVESYRDASKDILVDDDDAGAVRSDDLGGGSAGGGGGMMDLLGDLMMGGETAPPPAQSPMGGGGSLVDLMGGGGVVGAAGSLGGGLDDLMGGGGMAAGGLLAGGLATPKRLALPKNPEGLQISCRFIAGGGGRVNCEMTVENLSHTTGANTPMSGFAIQLNKNSYGLVPESPNALAAAMPSQLMPGQSHVATFALVPNGQPQDMRNGIQVRHPALFDSRPPPSPLALAHVRDVGKRSPDSKRRRSAAPRSVQASARDALMPCIAHSRALLASNACLLASVDCGEEQHQSLLLPGPDARQVCPLAQWQAPPGRLPRAVEGPRRTRGELNA